MDLKFTKFGVSAALLSMVCYFCGYYNMMAAIGMMVFVIACCDSIDAKKNAVQAVLFSIVMAIIGFILSQLSLGYSSFIDFLFNFIDNYKAEAVVRDLNIASILNNLVDLIRLIAMIIFVCISAKGKVVNIPVVTKMLNKHFKEQ